MIAIVFVFIFFRVVVRFVVFLRVAVLFVIIGLILRYVCVLYLLCGDFCCFSTLEDMILRFRRYVVRLGNRLTSVFVYRGDVS